MAKYDIKKFRNEHGITQKALAEILKVTQGFLSGVENYNSLFPAERKQYLLDAFPEVDFEQYRLPDDDKEDGKVKKVNSDNSDSLIDVNDPDLMKKFIDLIRDELKRDKGDTGRITQDLMTLMDKNAQLMAKIEELQEKNYESQNEILRLKGLLLDNGIKPTNTQ